MKNGSQLKVMNVKQTPTKMENYVSSILEKHISVVLEPSFKSLLPYRHNVFCFNILETIIVIGHMIPELFRVTVISYEIDRHELPVQLCRFEKYANDQTHTLNGRRATIYDTLLIHD